MKYYGIPGDKLFSHENIPLISHTCIYTYSHIWYITRIIQYHIHMIYPEYYVYIHTYHYPIYHDVDVIPWKHGCFYLQSIPAAAPDAGASCCCASLARSKSSVACFGLDRNLRGRSFDPHWSSAQNPSFHWILVGLERDSPFLDYIDLLILNRLGGKIPQQIINQQGFSSHCSFGGFLKWGNLWNFS